jgi:hypothetical protein
LIRALAHHLIAALAAIAVAAAPASAAGQGRSIEFAVKAAFLTKFAAFVTWPAGGGPAAICVVGSDPFGGRLEQAVRGQPGVTIRRLTEVDRSSGCHVVYAAGSSRQSVAEALQAVRGSPVLTVTDAAQGGARGMIHFVVFEDRVRFHIDAGQAAQSGLTISSKLLSLALSVKR